MALQELQILPSNLLKLDDRERAFIYGSLLYRAEKRKNNLDKIK